MSCKYGRGKRESTSLAQLGSGRTATLLMPYPINVTVIVGVSE